MTRTKYGRSNRQKNDIVIEGNITKIIIRNKEQQIIGECLIDTDDVEKIKIMKWALTKNQSGYKSIVGSRIRLSRFLCPGDELLEVDHINGDSLDNRKRNLRRITSQQNKFNKRAVGVYREKRSSKNSYVAQICCKKQVYCLGCFPTFEAAKSARREAEIKYFGEYRRMEV